MKPGRGGCSDCDYFHWEAIQPDGSRLFFRFDFDVRRRLPEGCYPDRMYLIGEGPRVEVQCQHRAGSPLIPHNDTMIVVEAVQAWN